MMDIEVLLASIGLEVTIDINTTRHRHMPKWCAYAHYAYDKEKEKLTDEQLTKYTLDGSGLGSKLSSMLDISNFGSTPVVALQRFNVWVADVFQTVGYLRCFNIEPSKLNSSLVTLNQRWGDIGLTASWPLDKPIGIPNWEFTFKGTIDRDPVRFNRTKCNKVLQSLLEIKDE